MRLVARTDENQAEIVAALRAIGAVVHCTHQLGGGFPDLTVAYGGRNWLLEVKMPGAKLTPDEEAFFAEWERRGQVNVVESVDDAIALVTERWY